MKNKSMEAPMYFYVTSTFFLRAAQNRWWKQAKAGTFLYSDRLQRENSMVPILKMINLKNPGIIDRKQMVLDVNAGFHFELSWYSCFPLFNSEQKKLNKHFSQINKRY